ALVGVMFIVVIGTFEWSSFRILGKVPKADAFVLVLVSGVTVATDLAIAVVVGVIVSALVFAWQQAKRIVAESHIDGNRTKVYRITGPLFFASVQSFKDLFDVQQDPMEVVIDFEASRVYDHSGLEAIDAIALRYTNAGKKVRLRHLSHECKYLLACAGDLVEVNVEEDPKYHIADNRLA
ncbi:MAG: STAS domain-containing protein, partial [Gammaproteobacteria bacterium]|nr:STAS domain-containing protein [Gammaproteobacteria bacterium]